MWRRPLIATATLLTLLAGAGLSAQTHAVQPDRYSGLRWRLVGPFDGGKVSGVSGIDGEPGVYVVSTPSGAFETHDSGETWTALDQPAPSAGSPEAEWIDRLNPTRVARVDAQGFGVSLDGGRTWTSHHNLPVAEIERVATSAGSPYWVFATTLTGQTTAVPSGPLSGPPPAAPSSAPESPRQTAAPIAGEPVRVIRADPKAARLRFAATAKGAFVSFDAGSRWSSLQLNLPHVPVTDLVVHDNDLVAATDGRSVWVLDDISPLRQIADEGADAAIVLFRPAAVDLRASGPGANIDYYLASTTADSVTIDIVDRTGLTVYSTTSAASAVDDPWAPVRAPLSGSAGGHRVTWNLRFNPPPTPSSRYRQLARPLFEALADDPDVMPVGPLVLPGAYQVRLTVGPRAWTEVCVVREAAADRTAAADHARIERFDLARRVYDGLGAAHDGYLKLARLRAAVKSLVASSNPDVAQAAAEFDARLADLDGSDWHFALPDADDPNEQDAVEDKEHDLPPPPPAPVALTKDYDDPTTIIGRAFQNVSHGPAFALTSEAMATLLGRIEKQPGAPPSTLVSDVELAEQQLAGARSAWDAAVAIDVPAFNQVLVAHGLPPIKTPPGLHP